ncbi:uncharacterized protein BDZ99DRAFT_430002 [Mytilinidion resinicola]|uniref:Uncharacterized protein n=1 Tax=Mytilinidion resinicola TaxID=574789 RepID=A0A6A6XY75_9PEZI|nr:uncharacterized protein BDZ99DRAFT_430002 [Mytilinidion resinicola]KAF2801501.1 hypothetical protein BDZ99DRAFT_430002 [Mytilinidion resinicola]
MPFSLDGSLPEELIDRIIQFVSSDPDMRRSNSDSPNYSALAPLCLTNKKINRIAMPHLYSAIFFKDDCYGSGVKYLLPFTFLMWQSPSHAALVRSFSSRGSWGEGGITPTAVLDPNDFDYVHGRLDWPKHDDLDSILKARVDEYAKGDEEANTWFEDVKTAEDEDAVLALLLPALPKLRKLDLIPDAFLHDTYVLRPFQRLDSRKMPLTAGQDDSSTPFGSLTDVLIAGEVDKYRTNPAIFFGALALPALRRLYTYRTGVEGQDEVNRILAAIPPESSPVEYIELRASKIYSPNLEKVLKIATPGVLKTFMYEIGCSWPWTPVKQEEILSALGPHAPHLEALALTHEHYYPYQDELDETPCALQFTHFPALKKLKLAPVFVWGHDGLFSPPQGDSAPAEQTKTQTRAIADYRSKLWRALAPSLEDLCVTCVRDLGVPGHDSRITPFLTHHLFPALEEVLLMKARHFPNLTKLKLEGPLANLENWSIDIVGFMRIAYEYGVTVTLVNMVGDSPYKGESREVPWGWDEDVRWKKCVLNQGHPKRAFIYEKGEHELEKRLKDLVAPYWVEEKEKEEKADERESEGTAEFTDGEETNSEESEGDE